jgi:hypothetical protein
MHNPIPYQAHDTSRQDGHRDRHFEPTCGSVSRNGGDNPPGIPAKTLPSGRRSVQIANLIEPIYSRVYQTHSRSIDTPHDGLDPGKRPQRLPDTHSTVDGDEARCEDADVCYHRPGDGVKPTVCGCEGSEVDGDWRTMLVRRIEWDRKPVILQLKLGPGNDWTIAKPNKKSRGETQPSSTMYLSMSLAVRNRD